MALPPQIIQAGVGLASAAFKEVAQLYREGQEAQREQTRAAFSRYLADMERFDTVFRTDAEALNAQVEKSFVLIRELIAAGEYELAATLHRTVIRDTSLTRALIDYHRQVTAANASSPPRIEAGPASGSDG
jgi:hypothetical protein